MGQYSPISSGGESRHDIGSSHAGNASSASSATQIFYLSKSNNVCKDDRSQLRDITNPMSTEMIASRHTGPIGPILVKLKSWVAGCDFAGARLHCHQCGLGAQSISRFVVTDVLPVPNTENR